MALCLHEDKQQGKCQNEAVQGKLYCEIHKPKEAPQWEFMRSPVFGGDIPSKTGRQK
jgi:hypothetical protein